VNPSQSKGYEVHGLLRRSASADVVDSRLIWLGIQNHVRLHDGNLADLSSLVRVLEEVAPQEIYNLAAQSFVKSSWQQPYLTGVITGLGATNMLEACASCVRTRASTRHRVPKCLVWRNNPANLRPLRFIRALHMPRPRSMLTR
jgi:GDP-D-mannose dehydratase